jgi:tetratricopeptide (TPR) repeat protein
MRLGPYELQGEIGRGAMGRVYRAVHLPTGAVRAVKTLTGAGDVELLLRFRREAEVLARLDGKGVVAVHDTGVEGRTPWLAMDLMPGASLAARIKSAGGTLPWREAVPVAVVLARTLSRCHAAGLVHRDLKPDNVLFGDDGEPRLADFGLVRDGASSLTETGTLLGTPAYMAPEQLEGKPVDGKADVFALGALLYATIAGRPASPGKTVVEIHRAAASGKRAPASAFASCPRALDRALALALAPRPDDRPSADELAKTLESVLGAKEGRPAPFLFAIGALLVSGAVVALWRPTRSAPVEPPAPRVGETAPETTRTALHDPPPVDSAPLEQTVVAGILHELEYGRYAAAVERCRAARERRPDDEWLRAFVADCLLDAGDVETALALADSCSDAKPGGARALAVRAYVHARRNDPAALAEADHAIARDPRLGRAWTARSYVLGTASNARDLDETSQERLCADAVAAGKKGSELAPPGRGAAHFAWARASKDIATIMEERDYAFRDGEAVFEYHVRFERLLPRSEANLPEEVRLLAEARQLLDMPSDPRRWRRARELAERSIETNRFRPAAYALAATASVLLEEWPAARDAVDRGLALDSWDVALNERASKCLVARGDYRGAREHLERAVRVAPLPGLYLDLAPLLGACEDLAGATACLDSAVALERDGVVAFTIRAEHRISIGDLDGARRDLADALHRSDREGTVYLARARLELATGDVEKARADWKHAVALGTEPFVHLVHAEILERDADVAGARAELAKFRSLFRVPNSEADLLERRLGERR